MRTTKLHFEIFKEECQKWIDVLELNHWDVYYSLGTDEKRTAQIARDSNACNATIYFTKTWDNTILPLNEREIRRAAKHEVIHLLIAELIGVAARRFINRDEFERIEEKLVKKLQKAIK